MHPMDSIEVEAKTYEEAVKRASAELNVDEGDLDIEVTEVDTKGILGLLGTKKVRITATVRAPSQEERQEENTGTFGARFLEDLSGLMGVPLTVEVKEEEHRTFFLARCSESGLLIGKEGETLESLQYLLKLALAKRFKESRKVTLDIDGFRDRRTEFLSGMAKRLVDKARKTGRSFKTEPLNPYERRIIHTFVKTIRGVTTKSEGEGHMKPVVISPTGKPYGRR
jgi:spoIIIJ-associated protein